MNTIEPIIRSNESLFSIANSPKVACPGVSGAYSHKACYVAFSEPKISYFPNFEDVFEAVSADICKYGIIPIENTLAGSVTDNYDLLLKYQLFIAGTLKIKIEHCLLGVDGASLEILSDVTSHPQALHQCSQFFRLHQNISPHEFSNTAAAAKFVAQLNSPHHAAIGSKDCAEKYALKIFAENIQNRKENFTRFVVISKLPVSHKDCTRISLILRVTHAPGALYRVLEKFANANINLLKLESRPIPESPFEALFYCDFVGNLNNPDISSVIESISADTLFLQNLGNYPEL